MGLNGSAYDYVIYFALIAILRASLITSFQPPVSVGVGGGVWVCGCGGVSWIDDGWMEK